MDLPSTHAASNVSAGRTWFDNYLHTNTQNRQKSLLCHELLSLLYAGSRRKRMTVKAEQSNICRLLLLSSIFHQIYNNNDNRKVF